MTEESGKARERERAAVGVSRRSAPPAQTAGWDPFERVFTGAGSIDRDYAAKRIPVLVDLLRRHPRCFIARIDLARLGGLLLGEDARGIRESPTQEGFEEALRSFSEKHLHELVDEPQQQAIAAALMEIARDEEITRRDRAGAALGVALLAVPPDATGLRGRGLMDLVLRVTMEEQTAQEQLRKRSRETEGGVPADELAKFWEQYPALRWHHEERYRREVTHVLRQIESDKIPPAVSVDLAVRGAAKLLSTVAEAKREGRQVDAREAEQILKTPFVQDMLDEGADVVVARWRAEMGRVGGVPSDERRALLRTLDIGARLLEERGPGSDVVLFYLYMRAVVQGHYHVLDDAELEAAKALFGKSGLVAAGALSYATHLDDRGEHAAAHRVRIAALEIWPEDADVRAAAEAMGLREEEAARAARLGPLYEDAAEGEPAAPAAPTQPAEDVAAEATDPGAPDTSDDAAPDAEGPQA